ncbi:MAG: hypothetical protein PHI37_05505 [Candidatus Gracilibacteria bacterium]|nr:hypothetical protein [Candidatus Gracilibacteria bacterium]
MLGFIKFLQKRPSDKTIIIGRILFGVIYMSAMYYNFFVQENPNTFENVFFWQEVSEQTLNYISYFIIGIGIVPIIMGATNICVAKKSIMRIVQIIFGISLFYISSKIVEGPDLDIDALVFFMAFLPFFAGITGKCITSKCMKYGEKVTKIRV